MHREITCHQNHGCVYILTDGVKDAFFLSCYSYNIAMWPSHYANCLKRRYSMSFYCAAVWHITYSVCTVSDFCYYSDSSGLAHKDIGSEEPLKPCRKRTACPQFLL